MRGELHPRQLDWHDGMGARLVEQPQYGQDNWPGEDARWWRYMVHRLGAGVIWVLGSEYNMNNYGNLGVQFWKDLGAMIDAEDPYDRIIGASDPAGMEGDEARSGRRPKCCTTSRGWITTSRGWDSSGA